MVAIFTNNAEEREAALDALRAAGVSFHMVAAMGGTASGLAYANMLHNSDLLGPSLVASMPRRPSKAQPPSCPSISLSSRIPAHMRPKGGGRLAPWAKKAAAAADDAADEAADGAADEAADGAAEAPCTSNGSNAQSPAANSRGEAEEQVTADTADASADAVPTATPTPSDTDPPDDAASSGETR